MSACADRRPSSLFALAAQGRDNLKVDQLRRDELLAVQTFASTVAVAVVVGERWREYGCVERRRRIISSRSDSPFADLR